MPILDGYGLCRQVRSLDRFKETPFIFVSAKITLEEKIKGYDVGGYEYIAKPLEGQEVVIKVQNIIENRIKHSALTQRLQDSHNAAMQAMTYTSNLGQVLQFMKSTTDTYDFDVLADKLFDTTSMLGLSVVIQFHTPAGVVNYKKLGEVTPLEANVIEMARGKNRIFDFQARPIFNYKDFSLLILNMPLDDTDKYGMMKDVLSNLCDTIESKVKLLSTKVVVKQKDDVLSTVTRALETIDQSYRDIQQANMSAIDDMILRMEDVIFGFGLSESQEDVVRGIVQYGKKKISDIYEDGAELFGEFEKIHDTLVRGLK